MIFFLSGCEEWGSPLSLQFYFHSFVSEVGISLIHILKYEMNYANLQLIILKCMHYSNFLHRLRKLNLFGQANPIIIFGYYYLTINLYS